MNNIHANTTIAIAFICDANFVLPTSVAIVSLIKNKKKTTHYDIYVIMSEYSEQNASKFLSFDNADDVKIHIIKGSLDQYNSIPQGAHVTISALLKFDICELIPEYDKILYLDGDLIIRSDLSDLYHIDLEGKHAAVVKNSRGILDGSDYFFSGLILFDAQKMRTDHVKDELVQTRRDLKQRKSMDMTTFNMVLENRVLFVDPKYDCPLGRVEYERKFYRISEYNKFYNSNYRNWKDLLNQSLIIHYCGAEKPWKYSFGWYNKEWMYYFKQLPFEENLIRKSFCDYMKEQISKNGKKAVYYYVKDKMMENIGPLSKKRLEKIPGDFV